MKHILSAGRRAGFLLALLAGAVLSAPAESLSADYDAMVSAFRSGDAEGSAATAVRIVTAIDRQGLSAATPGDTVWQYLDACYIASLPLMDPAGAPRAREFRQKARKAASFLGNPVEEAGKVLQLAEVPALLGNHAEAVSLAREALALVERAPGADPAFLARTQFEAARYLLRRGEPADLVEADGLFTRCEAAVRPLADYLPLLADTQYYRSEARFKADRIQGALDGYLEAERLFDSLGDGTSLAMTRMHLAEIYYRMNGWAKCVESADRSLSFFVDGGDAEARCFLLNLKGNALDEERDTTGARAAYEAALSVAEKAASPDLVGSARNNLALLLLRSGDADGAIARFRELITDAEKRGDAGSVVTATNNLVSALSLSGRDGEALAALERILCNTSLTGKIDPYTRITLLGNAGMLSSLLGKPADAARSFREALPLVEALRRTAPDELKRDYLAGEIRLYTALGYSCYGSGKPAEAAAALEQGRARYLAEKLGIEGFAFGEADVASLRASIPAGTALVAYSGMDGDAPLMTVLTRDALRVLPVDRKEITLRLGVLAQAATASNGRLRGLAVVRTQTKAVSVLPAPATGLEREIEGFGSIVNYYRTLLSAPASGTAREHRDAIAAVFGTYLVAPALEGTPDIDTLVIIPDGILGFLPFEAFRDGQGYLLERYQICYAQSLQLYARSAAAASGRKAGRALDGLLAVGNPVYNTDAISGAPAGNGRGLSVVSLQPPERQQEITASGMAAFIGSGARNLRDCYASLGIVSWPDLPGTGREVSALTSLVRNSRSLTGSKASEAEIKRLSLSGELRKFPFIHFAVHGLVVPGYPELAALVLAQDGGTDRDSEDGYLRMDEVAALKLDADLVTLSACETGLGKVYGGEGVVGLTQAFFRAGARAVEVSLWQVSDDSTAALMQRAYTLASSGGNGLADAWRRSKMEFLSDPVRKDPFYWAPFVLYGQ